MTTPRKVHPAQIAIEQSEARLIALARELSRISVDRVRYPSDSERLDDLRVALLEGHLILAEIDKRYGEANS